MRSLVLNEGLEVLGSFPYTQDDDYELGIFEGTVLDEVVLPSTLREMRYRIFSNCT